VRHLPASHASRKRPRGERSEERAPALHDIRCMGAHGPPVHDHSCVECTGARGDLQHSVR
jgi:hypothetical protein